MALSQLVTKTYGRRARQADTSDAARAFDEVFKNDKPAVRAASTAEKWGNTTFKKICTSNSPSKRKMTSTCDSSDPFSFESDDDGKSKKLKKDDAKTSCQNQKAPIVVKISKTVTSHKERENQNKDVDCIENLKTKSSLSRHTRDKKKTCDYKITEKAVNPAVAKHTGNDLSAVQDAEHLPSSKNGLDLAKRVLNNSAGKKLKTCHEPITDRTLQLECYDITEQQGRTSVCEVARKDQQSNHLQDHLSVLSITLSNGKKTIVDPPRKELVAEKCEKQAQVFVSRFARLFSSRRVVTSDTPDKTGCINSHAEAVITVTKELKNNNNQKLLTTQKKDDELPCVTGKNCLVKSFSDGGTCSSRHVSHDLSENGLLSGVTRASSSIKDNICLSRDSSAETLDVRKSVKQAPVTSRETRQLTLSESWGPCAQATSLHDSGSDYSVQLLSDSSDVQTSDNSPAGVAGFVKTGSKPFSLRPLASDKCRRSIMERNKLPSEPSGSICLTLKKNSASSGCSDEFKLSSERNKLYKSLSDGSSSSSLQITPELHDNRQSSEVTRTSSSRKLLLSGSKRMMRSKAVYNPRQWNDPNELMSDGSSQTSGNSVKPSSLSTDSVAAFDDFDIDSVPLRVPPSVNRGSGDASTRTLSFTNDTNSCASTKFMVKKELKPLYTVVHHVKQAHECQEYGETQEFCDDIDYIMDGLSDSQPIATRCLSAISLASKCSTSAFRMHIRAHGTLSKVFCALHDAPDHPSLSLCTSAIMFMMSRDHLAMDIEKSSLQLMLRLLNIDNNDKVASDRVEYNKIRQRLQVICSPASVTPGRSRRSKSISFEDTTPGNLSMETLLSLTSKQAGDWFKDSMRSLGGLEQIINTVCRCIDVLDNDELASIETMPTGCELLKQLQCVERCIRVLESVSLSNAANQSFLYSYKSTSFVKAVHRLLRLLSKHLPHTTVNVVSDEDVLDKDQPNHTMAACLVNSLRLLFNIIHDNESTSNVIGQIEGMLDTLLSCTLRSPQNVPVSQRFDLIILGLGLLTNLIESSASNRSQLIALKSLPPFDHPYPMTENTVDSLEALGMMFSSRYEAAKLVEEEQDAEIEEAERRQQASLDAAHEKASAKTLGKKNQQAGEWCESDSGMLWHPADSSTLDDSSDGLAALQACRQEAAAMAGNPIGASSQEEDENYTKVLHTAGKHMEDSIVAAYVALLIGTIVQHNMDLAESVRDTLPGFSFSPMVQMLSKFLGFMNLTRGSGTSASKSIQKIIDVLEAC